VTKQKNKTITTNAAVAAIVFFAGAIATWIALAGFYSDDLATAQNLKEALGGDYLARGFGALPSKQMQAISGLDRGIIFTHPPDCSGTPAVHAAPYAGTLCYYSGSEGDSVGPLGKYFVHVISARDNAWFQIDNSSTLLFSHDVLLTAVAPGEETYFQDGPLKIKIAVNSIRADDNYTVVGVNISSQTCNSYRYSGLPGGRASFVLAACETANDPVTGAYARLEELHSSQASVFYGFENATVESTALRGHWFKRGDSFAYWTGTNAVMITVNRITSSTAEVRLKIGPKVFGTRPSIEAENMLAVGNNATNPATGYRLRLISITPGSTNATFQVTAPDGTTAAPFTLAERRIRYATGLGTIVLNRVSAGRNAVELVIIDD